MSQTFVIFDTEYTSWKGAQEQNWSNKNQHRELVQIGAIKVDKNTLTEVDSLDVCVKPKINPTLSDYFIDLTGLTNEMIMEKGVSFEEAITGFYDFCRGEVAFSYGNDMMILAENIGYYKAEYLSPGFVFFKNWRDFFYRADEETKKIVSGDLAKYFKVDGFIDGDAHNALYDCRSQLEAFRHLYQKGHKFLF